MKKANFPIKILNVLGGLGPSWLEGESANFDETIATISGPRSSPLPPIYYTGLAIFNGNMLLLSENILDVFKKYSVFPSLFLIQTEA